MKTTHILALLLALQVALVAWFNLREPAPQFDTQAIILEVPGKIEGARIEDSNGGLVTMLRNRGAWEIVEHDNAEGDLNKIDDFISRMTTLTPLRQVGSSLIAAKQFQLTDENFVRKVTIISAGEEEHVLYVGSSPSYKQAHVRAGDSEDSYLAALSSHELSTNAEAWLMPPPPVADEELAEESTNSGHESPAHSH